MAADTASGTPTTDIHRGPDRPTAPGRRPALICAYPRPAALALPDSGVAVGRTWLAERGLTDTEVSGSHLRFDRAGGSLRVVDLGSRNGTWVNGAPLAPNDAATLDEGALLRMGRTLFVVRERLLGSFDPAEPIGELVGPYGLRSVAATIDGLVRQRPSNVLIEGETGTGKELTARAVAKALGRDQPYGPVNIAGVAAGVFESQLFGHVAGAFSGSRGAAPGIIVAHDGGTVFLDEIGELPLPLQSKLLRLLDNREVLPVGADRAIHADVLMLAATNRPLEQMVEQGDFRSDLYARLSQARIPLPPLRDRSEDIFAIAGALARRSGGELNAADVEIEAVERLLLQPWPRNVRQLMSSLEAAHRVDPAPGLRLWALEQVLGPAPDIKPALNREIVEAMVEACDGNVTEAAKKLGVSRGKLLRFRKRHR